MPLVGFYILSVQSIKKPGCLGVKPCFFNFREKKTLADKTDIIFYC
jgi:hypothetical protein